MEVLHSRCMHTAHGNMNFVQEFYLSRQGVARNLQCGGAVCVRKQVKTKKQKKDLQQNLDRFFVRTVFISSPKIKPYAACHWGAIFSTSAEIRLKVLKTWYFPSSACQWGGGYSPLATLLY